jgi:hypothetical protein
MQETLELVSKMMGVGRISGPYYQTCCVPATYRAADKKECCLPKLAAFLCTMPFVAGLSVQYQIRLWRLQCTQLTEVII